MKPIVLADLHDRLLAAGIPILSVRLTKDLAVELVFQEEATAEQKLSALVIVEKYDQAEVDAAKPTFDGPLSAEEINAAKTLPELKALLVKAFTTKG